MTEPETQKKGPSGPFFLTLFGESYGMAQQRRDHAWPFDTLQISSENIGTAIMRAKPGRPEKNGRPGCVVRTGLSSLLELLLHGIFCGLHVDFPQFRLFDFARRVAKDGRIDHLFRPFVLCHSPVLAEVYHFFIG